jgi:GNAT superfamily N-acetyltransferase
MHITNLYSYEISTQLLKLLVASSKSCPYLTPRTEAEVINWLFRGLVHYAKVDDQIVGWIVLEPLTKSCIEIKSFYVIPIYNGRGYGSELLNYSIAQGNEFISVSSNPQVISMLQKRGLTTIPIYRLPIVILYRFIVTRKISSFKKGIKTKVSFLYKK